MEKGGSTKILYSFIIKHSYTNLKEFNLNVYYYLKQAFKKKNRIIHEKLIDPHNYSDKILFAWIMRMALSNLSVKNYKYLNYNAFFSQGPQKVDGLPSWSPEYKRIHQ